MVLFISLVISKQVEQYLILKLKLKYSVETFIKHIGSHVYCEIIPAQSTAHANVIQYS
jgi:hypothetical protein